MQIRSQVTGEYLAVRGRLECAAQLLDRVPEQLPPHLVLADDRKEAHHGRDSEERPDEDVREAVAEEPVVYPKAYEQQPVCAHQKERLRGRPQRRLDQDLVARALFQRGAERLLILRRLQQERPRHAVEHNQRAGGYEAQPVGLIRREIVDDGVDEESKSGRAVKQLVVLAFPLEALVGLAVGHLGGVCGLAL